MSDGNNDNKFYIDINFLNTNLKKYLYSRLKNVWGNAKEGIEQISIHLGIVDVSEKWDSSPEIHIYSENIKSGYQVVTCNGNEQMEDFFWNKINHSKNEVNQNKVVEISESLYCNPIDSRYINLGGTYKLYWYVESTIQDKKEVFTLVMRVIALFLKECISDISQIGFIDDSFAEKKENEEKEEKEENEKSTPIEEFKRTCEKYNFIEKYTQLVFLEYGYIPDKEICCELSKIPYEKRECRGRILLADTKIFESIGEGNGKFLFESDKIKIKDKSGVPDTRKMLEVCQDKSYLVVEKSEDMTLLGFIHAEEPIKEGVVLEFKGEAHWCVSINGEEVLFYRRDSYSISKQQYIKSQVAKLDGISGLSTEYREEILNELELADHGALMIIAEDAKELAECLCQTYNRGIFLKDFSLGRPENRKMIRGLAAVDGAIFVDFNWNCVAFGVILDGKAKVKGETNRGARYNSAKNYIAGQNMAAIIVSEDKVKGVEIKNGKEIEVI